MQWEGRRTRGRCRGVDCISCRHRDDLPCIVTALGVIAGVIEQATEVHKDGSRSVCRDKVSLHFLWRRKWWDCDGSVLQADMVLLSKCLNQCRSLKQGKDSPADCFLFLKQWRYARYRKTKMMKQPVTEGINQKYGKSGYY
jgi:hypothetical protein